MQEQQRRDSFIVGTFGELLFSRKAVSFLLPYCVAALPFLKTSSNWLACLIRCQKAAKRAIPVNEKRGRRRGAANPHTVKEKKKEEEKEEEQGALPIFVPEQKFIASSFFFPARLKEIFITSVLLIYTGRKQRVLYVPSERKIKGKKGRVTRIFGGLPNGWQGRKERREVSKAKQIQVFSFLPFREKKRTAHANVHVVMHAHFPKQTSSSKEKISLVFMIKCIACL